MTKLRKLITVLRLSTISSYRVPRAFFSRQTVAYRLVAAGELPSRRLGGRVYVVTAALRELVAA